MPVRARKPPPPPLREADIELRVETPAADDPAVRDRALAILERLLDLGSPRGQAR